MFYESNIVISEKVAYKSRPCLWILVNYYIQHPMSLSGHNTTMFVSTNQRLQVITLWSLGSMKVPLTSHAIYWVDFVIFASPPYTHYEHTCILVAAPYTWTFFL